MRLDILVFAVAVLTGTKMASARDDTPVRVVCGLPSSTVHDAVVREHPKLRGCYEDGLRRNSLLEGLVTVRLIIARDGSVMHVADGGSDIRDPETIACVVGVFRAMRFAAPSEKAAVQVQYPVRFTRYGGGLRAADVRAGLASRLGRVRLCAETARESNPNVTGMYVVELVVDSDGVARATDAGSDVGDATACAARALDRMQLPPPWEPVTFRVRIELDP